MTRRKVIFWNDLNDSYIVSEEYNGDKAEMERFGLGACDHTWPEFMEAMSSVSNMADFLKVISYITASYHATVNGVPLPEQANNLPGSRLNVAHSHKELYNLVGDMDEVGEPYSSKLDEKTGEWRSIYATFRKVGGEWPNGIWEYCGHCFRGETVERGKEMDHI